MKYFLFVTGCYQNYYDAEHIAHLLEKMGYVLGTEKNANIIVVFACSVRQKPIDRIFGKIKNWQKLPQKPKIILCGCVLPRDKKTMSEKIDLITDTDNFSRDFKKLQISKINKIGIKNKKKISLKPKDINSDTAMVPIMFGCNNFCTYCAVPYTRGREKSRDEKEIITEIKKQLQNGKKKILLLGQNVNSFQFSVVSGQSSVNRELKTENRKLTTDIIPFATLLKKIDAIPGDFTFNFTSSNPHDFHESLINTLPKLKKWERVLQLPLQSGDDEILRKMNRKYTQAQFFRLISNIKYQIPNLKLTTDIIVGFPGETKEQFNNTVKLCKQIGFSKIYAAQYSPRPGTPAAKMTDDVSQKEKKRRWDVINSLMIN